MDFSSWWPWTWRDEGFVSKLILGTQNESEMSKLVQIVVTVVTEKTLSENVLGV